MAFNSLCSFARFDRIDSNRRIDIRSALRYWNLGKSTDRKI